MDARSQFETNDPAVNPRLAVRRGCFHGFVMNIGTPVSIRAPAAITERMTPALVKRFRNEIGLPIPQPS
jgi:hypothetical protein